MIMEKIYCVVCNDLLGEWDGKQNIAFACNDKEGKGHVYCVFRNLQHHISERAIFDKYAASYNRVSGKLTITKKWEDIKEKPFVVSLDLGIDSNIPTSDEQIENIILMG